MPELPEMETYRILLAQRIQGRTITETEVNRVKSINVDPHDFRQEVSGRVVTAIERRAKHLLFRLDSGKVLLTHLMLGGWMYYGNHEDQPENHAQVTLCFGEDCLYFLGLRFGYVHLLTKADMEENLADLGPEPLSPEFSEGYFTKTMQKKRGILKNTLVNQHLIAGIGNRYSDEICFQARQLPVKKCSDLTDEDISALYQAIPATLRHGIQNGGYINRPFNKNDTLTGGFADNCAVYNREGESCNRCGGTIVKEKLSSRKVFYCSNCQR